MNYLKKLSALALAVVMVLALAMTASATGTGSITVENPVKDKTYTAYKIFDVVYNNDQSSYSYTIANDSEWFSVVATKNSDGTVQTKITGLEFQKLYSDDVAKNTYAVKEETGFSAAEFAETLKAAIDNNGNLKNSGKVLTRSGNPETASISGLDLGYYFVTSTSGALCNLITTNPDATIHDKNDVPFDKVDDKESVEIGEIVNYTITGKVPDATGHQSYTYEIFDTMSVGLTFRRDVQVKIDNNVLNPGGDTYSVTYDVNSNPNSFKVSINVMEQQDKIGEAIEVTYSAVVNEKAVEQVSENEAVLKYSNDPADDTSVGEFPPEKETVYSAKIVIDKYAGNPNNADDTSKKLSGATFVLYKENATTSAKSYYKYTAPEPADGINPAVEAKVEWVPDIKDATEMTTDVDGATEFIGLKDGTYYLEEITAPTGYNPLAEPVEVKIVGKKTEGTTVKYDLKYTQKIANNAGAELPSTGGMGTTIFYVAGSILLVGAVVLLVTKKRMGREE